MRSSGLIGSFFFVFCFFGFYDGNDLMTAGGFMKHVLLSNHLSFVLSTLGYPRSGCSRGIYVGALV